MAKFTVDRRTWYRGKGEKFSALLREDGTRCCIGFVGAQCGISDQELMGHPGVTGVRLPLREHFPKWMQEEGGDVINAYGDNDDEALTDAEREERLKVRFAKYGDEIEFIN